MKIPVRCLTVTFLFTILAACGNSQSLNPAPPQVNLAAPALSLPAVRKHPTLYASLQEGEVFYGYKLPHNAPFCTSQQIPSTFVDSIGADSAGTLWVPTSSSAGGFVYSYAPKCGTQGTTLNVPGGAYAHPLGIAFGRNSTKYVVGINYSTYSGFVAVYPEGDSNPTAELTDPRLNNGNNPVGVAVRAGKVYVLCCGAYYGYGAPAYIIKFPSEGSQQRGSQIFLKQLKSPGLSVTFDSARNMIIPDQGTSSIKPALRIYAPPYSGTPISYPLQGASPQCSLSRKQDSLACADSENSTVDLYSYPSLSYLYSLPVQTGPSEVPVVGVAFAASAQQ